MIGHVIRNVRKMVSIEYLALLAFVSFFPVFARAVDIADFPIEDQVNEAPPA